MTMRDFQAAGSELENILRDHPLKTPPSSTRTLQGVLSDLWPQDAPIERTLIWRVLQAGIVDEMLAGSPATISEAAAEAYAAKLVDREGLSLENARWAIQVWVRALALFPAVPIPTPPPTHGGGGGSSHTGNEGGGITPPPVPPPPGGGGSGWMRALRWAVPLLIVAALFLALKVRGCSPNHNQVDQHADTTSQDSSGLKPHPPDSSAQGPDTSTIQQPQLYGVILLQCNDSCLVKISRSGGGYTANPFSLRPGITGRLSLLAGNYTVNAINSSSQSLSYAVVVASKTSVNVAFTFQVSAQQRSEPEKSTTFDVRIRADAGANVTCVDDGSMALIGPDTEGAFHLARGQHTFVATSIEHPDVTQNFSVEVGEGRENSASVQLQSLINSMHPSPPPQDFTTPSDTKSQQWVAGLRQSGIVIIGNLMWTMSDGNGKDINADEAQEQARGLNRAGYRDWRLPTIDELTELANSGRLESEGFRIGGSHMVWSSTRMNGYCSMWNAKYKRRETDYRIYRSVGRALFVRRATP
jgi:hypothetical protein